MSNDTLPKVDPEAVALRAAPQKVTRLNRRMLVTLAGLLAAAVMGATFWALQSPKRHLGAQTELYNVDKVTRAEDLDRLPADYGKLPAKPDDTAKAVPQLGEPLPGDLGPAIVHAQGGPAPGTGYNAAQADRQAWQQESDEAAKSSVFFRSGAKAGTAAGAVAGAQVSANAPGAAAVDAAFDPMAAGPASTAAQPNDPTTVQNRQDQKAAFLAKGGETATRNSGTLQAPASPYTVMAGAIIPAALVTGINSDLPGEVIATVTEPVYDTATGRYLLIPQGSRLLGRYDSQVAFGQRRALLVWNRLILPDASSIALDKLPGVDEAGYAGLEDGVDWHTSRLLAGAALSTLLGVSSELATSNQGTANGNVVVAFRDSAQGTTNQVGQEITRRNLNVQPTLTVRPGFPMRVMVNQDLVLRPYQPLFFQKGSSQ